MVEVDTNAEEVVVSLWRRADLDLWQKVGLTRTTRRMRLCWLLGVTKQSGMTLLMLPHPTLDGLPFHGVTTHRAIKATQHHVSSYPPYREKVRLAA